LTRSSTSGLAVEVLGGALLIAGAQTRFVALGIAVFTLATAGFFHTNFADQNQMIHFMKNFAIMGGLLQVAAFGGGKFSTDYLLRRRSAASIDAALAPAK
jgi:putative oxidoreductase